MEIEGSEGAEIVDQSQLTVRPNCQVSDSAAAVAPGAVTPQPFQADIQVFMQGWHARAGTHSSTHGAVVVRTHG